MLAPLPPAPVEEGRAVQEEKEILALNAFDRSKVSAMDAALRDAVERRLRSFGSASVLFYQEPIRMERAEGVWMFDAEGRRYLDLYIMSPRSGIRIRTSLKPFGGRPVG